MHIYWNFSVNMTRSWYLLMLHCIFGISEINHGHILCHQVKWQVVIIRYWCSKGLQRRPNWFDYAGFEGKKCEKLSSISLQEKDAYVSLPPLNHRPRANVTLVLSTRQPQGVILYHGVDEHLGVELFRGRLRVSYNIGNYPGSTMFSYEQLSDGL